MPSTPPVPLDRPLLVERLLDVGPLLLLAALPLVVVIVLTLDNSAAARAVVGRQVCPEGWTLSMGTPNARTTRNANNVEPWCHAANGLDGFVSRRTQALMLSPIVVGVLGMGLHLVFRKPKAQDHLRVLKLALAHGALSPAQYDTLRRAVLDDPDMTRARFDALMRDTAAGPH